MTYFTFRDNKLRYHSELQVNRIWLLSISEHEHCEQVPRYYFTFVIPNK